MMGIDGNMSIDQWICGRYNPFGSSMKYRGSSCAPFCRYEIWATKRYVQAKKQLHKMMLQVPHTYPGGAYKKPLAFLFLTLKPDARTIKISPTSLVSDHLCSITVLNFLFPKSHFVGKHQWPNGR